MADPCAVIYRLTGHYYYMAQVGSQSEDRSCAVIGRGGRSMCRYLPSHRTLLLYGPGRQPIRGQELCCDRERWAIHVPLFTVSQDITIIWPR